MAKKLKNCHSCGLAKDQGKDFACRWDPEKKLAPILPFYPVVFFKLTKTAVPKEKVPERDCAAWEKKPKAKAAP